MGRYRSSESDSDYGRSSSKKSKRKKKERRRGRSRSSSQSDSSRYSSSRHNKKSKKKHRSSPSPERRGERSRRSRSRSYDKHSSRSRRRSRSRSYEKKSARRSRSPDTARRRSLSRSRDRRSRSRDRRSRSGSRDRRLRDHRRSRSRSRSKDRIRSSRETSHSSVSQGLTSMQGLSMDDHRQQTMAEQADERMRQALKAAAAADEKLRLEALKHDGRTESPDPQASKKFASSVAAIESDSFVQSSFKSSASNALKIKDEPYEMRSSHDDAIFGSLSVSGFTLKPDPDSRPIDLEADSIVHPSLFCDPEDKMDRWIERLSQLRRRKLEGEAMQ